MNVQTYTHMNMYTHTYTHMSVCTYLIIKNEKETYSVSQILKFP